MIHGRCHSPPTATIAKQKQFARYATPYIRRSKKVFAHSDVTHMQTALPEARIKCPRPTRNGHNRQDAKRLRRGARHRFRESLGPLHTPAQKTHPWALILQDPPAGQHAPGQAHHQPDQKSRTLQNTTATRDYRNWCHASRKKAISFRKQLTIQRDPRNSIRHPMLRSELQLALLYSEERSSTQQLRTNLVKQRGGDG